MTPVEIFLFILSLIIGYIIGTINPGYLLGRIKGIDLREVGTRNPGTSNAWHELGKKYGILTGFYDIAKSFIACVVSILLLGLNSYFAQFSGMMAIIGHCFPFYLKFRGGKGVATSLGMILYYGIMYMVTSEPLDYTMVFLSIYLLLIALLFIYITHVLRMLVWIILPFLGYGAYVYYPHNEFNIFFLTVLFFLFGYTTYVAVVSKKFTFKGVIFKKDWIRMIFRLLGIAFLIFYDVVSKVFSLFIIYIFGVIYVTIDLQKILWKNIETEGENVSLDKKDERKRFSLFSNFLVGSFITIMIFPREIAFSATIFLIFGGISRKIIGLGFGRYKFLNKSLEGTLAYLGCMGLCGFVLLTLLEISPIVLMLGGITAFITDLLSIEINDNFTVPIISASVMYGAMLVGL